jgi:hypothetical protein
VDEKPADGDTRELRSDPAHSSKGYHSQDAHETLTAVIVRPASAGIHLITQPDHAHLAREVMEHCVALRGNPRRDTILYAIDEHDAGWAPEDAAPTVNESGQVVDFVTAALAVRHRVWPTAVAQLAGEPWAAALVAQHAITVYDRYRADPAWDSFFERMQTERDAMLRASGMPLEDLLTDYVFVRLGDLISLAFCTTTMGEQRFREWTVVLQGSRVLVHPDLFGGAEIPMQIAARALSRTRFDSEADLREALHVAPTPTLSGEVAYG